MNALAEITADDVRQYLITRAEAYVARTETSLSHVSQEAVQDSKFLSNAKRGDNFTLKTYQRVIDWLNEHEAKA